MFYGMFFLFLLNAQMICIFIKIAGTSIRGKPEENGADLTSTELSIPRFDPRLAPVTKAGRFESSADKVSEAKN
jgi:Na+/H+-translocating membrane pyrophosphatase